MLKIIAAVGRELELGINGGLIWRLPGDMRFFKENTTGCAVIMGRRTYESIGRPLPNRKNIVISSREQSIPGVSMAGSLEEAIELAKADPCTKDIFIIGGASVYSQALSIADELILTEVDASCPEADCFFPRFNREDYSKTEIGSGSDGGIKYRSVSYKR